MFRVVGQLDSNFGWAAGRLVTAPPDEWASFVSGLRGAYAGAARGPAGVRIVRDALGINKLFWARRPDGELCFAARPRHLVKAGCSFEDIWSVPPATAVELDPDGHARRAVAAEQPGWPTAFRRQPLQVAVVAERIRSELDRYCAALARELAGTPVYVCLSGGLDSTGIAVVARSHVRGLRAVSFDLDWGGRASSGDRLTAARLAADLGLPLIRVTVSAGELLELLDTVLVEGIDWRDFNVHAGLVNAALARGIARLHASDAAAPVALTGDIANELLADYNPEQLGGRTFYALPRVPLPRLRDALVRGLDASHREVGPFLAWGVRAVQPYAVTVDHYLSLPDAFLGLADRKAQLCRMMFGDEIPGYVYERPKTRAQVGGRADGGVLGLCLDQGVDERFLRARFAALHSVADPTLLSRFICGGRYRAALPAGGDVS
jgi:asparagine synthetase B (glutamine-hydrolysing)